MKKNDNQDRLEAIQVLIEAGNAQEAVLEAEAYLTQWGNSDTLAILYGEALIRTGDLIKARAVIRQGLLINGENYELYYMLGQTYEAEDNIGAAGICYRYSLFSCKTEDDRLYLNEELKTFLEKYGQIQLLKTALLLCPGRKSEWLKRNLERIEQYNPEDSYEIIIVEDITGKEGIYNSGIEEAGKKADLLIIPEHIDLMPYTLFNLQLTALTQKDCGILTPVFQNEVSDTNSISVILNGPAYYIRRCVINECGRLDSRLGNLRYQMADLGFRAVGRGYLLYQCGCGAIQDKGFNPEKETADTQEIFYARWGVKLSYSCFARRDLLDLMHSETRQHLYVLEVGCACGASLLAIKEKFAEAVLHGIELDEGPAKIAANFADVRTGNIENMVMDYECGGFDYILFGDVLEHLYDPEGLLKKMKPCLKKGGQILASIPNVMHISVVKNLLAGYWSYEDAGILDRTHLRFFTCTEIISMFQRAGYQVEEAAMTQIAISHEDEKLIAQLSAIKNASPQLFQSYQYLIRAKRIEG